MKKFCSTLMSLVHKEVIPFYRKYFKLLLFIFVLIGSVLLILQTKNLDKDYSELNKGIILIFILLWVGVWMTEAMARLSDKMYSRYEYREYLVKELEREEAETLELDNEEITDAGKQECEDLVEGKKDGLRKSANRDIIALMLKNNDELTEYFKISKRQAKSSYRFSIISCIIGIIMLGMAIYGVLVIDDMQLTIIGLISAAITELISGTVLWIHNKSALQLNHYYGALHDNEKFLSAVNIADKLSDENKEKMYIEIIRKQIDIKTEKE